MSFEDFTPWRSDIISHQLCEEGDDRDCSADSDVIVELVCLLEVDLIDRAEVLDILTPHSIRSPD